MPAGMFLLRINEIKIWREGTSILFGKELNVVVSFYHRQWFGVLLVYYNASVFHKETLNFPIK